MTLVDPRPSPARDQWIDVCGTEAVVVGRGVCALVEGRAVAIFRCEVVLEAEELDRCDRWFAVDNRDPFTGASVLSRGLVGSVGTQVVVVSPLLKQRFDLVTGACLDGADVTLDRWAVQVVDDRVLVASTPARVGVEPATERSSGGHRRETESKHGPATIRP